jgi:prepilin-type N-terminal cleavage/methylation domain-containing protein
MKPRPPISSGFTLIEILIVVGIIGLLLAMALPAFSKSRELSQKNLCIENMTQIESAKQLWALEHNKGVGELPLEAELFGTAAYMKARPQCPTGSPYDWNAIGDNAQCLSLLPGHTL